MQGNNWTPWNVTWLECSFYCPIQGVDPYYITGDDGLTQFYSMQNV